MVKGEKIKDIMSWKRRKWERRKVQKGKSGGPNQKSETYRLGIFTSSFSITTNSI